MPGLTRQIPFIAAFQQRHIPHVDRINRQRLLDEIYAIAQLEYFRVSANDQETGASRIKRFNGWKAQKLLLTSDFPVAPPSLEDLADPGVRDRFLRIYDFKVNRTWPFTRARVIQRSRRERIRVLLKQLAVPYTGGRSAPRTDSFWARFKRGIRSFFGGTPVDVAQVPLAVDQQGLVDNFKNYSDRLDEVKQSFDQSGYRELATGYKSRHVTYIQQEQVRLRSIAQAEQKVYDGNVRGFVTDNADLFDELPDEVAAAVPETVKAHYINEQFESKYPQLLTQTARDAKVEFEDPVLPGHPALPVDDLDNFSNRVRALKDSLKGVALKFYPNRRKGQAEYDRGAPFRRGPDRGDQEGAVPAAEETLVEALHKLLDTLTPRTSMGLSKKAFKADEARKLMDEIAGDYENFIDVLENTRLTDVRKAQVRIEFKQLFFEFQQTAREEVAVVQAYADAAKLRLTESRYRLAEQDARCEFMSTQQVSPMEAQCFDGVRAVGDDGQPLDDVWDVLPKDQDETQALLYFNLLKVFGEAANNIFEFDESNGRLVVSLDEEIYQVPALYKPLSDYLIALQVHENLTNSQAYTMGLLAFAAAYFGASEITEVLANGSLRTAKTELQNALLNNQRLNELAGRRGVRGGTILKGKLSALLANIPDGLTDVATPENVPEGLCPEESGRIIEFYEFSALDEGHQATPDGKTERGTLVQRRRTKAADQRRQQRADSRFSAMQVLDFEVPTTLEDFEKFAKKIKVNSENPRKAKLSEVRLDLIEEHFNADDLPQDPTAKAIIVLLRWYGDVKAQEEGKVLSNPRAFRDVAREFRNLFETYQAAREVVIHDPESGEAFIGDGGVPTANTFIDNVDEISGLEQNCGALGEMKVAGADKRPDSLERLMRAVLPMFGSTIREIEHFADNDLPSLDAQSPAAGYTPPARGDSADWAVGGLGAVAEEGGAYDDSYVAGAAPEAGDGYGSDGGGKQGGSDSADSSEEDLRGRQSGVMPVDADEATTVDGDRAASVMSSSSAAEGRADLAPLASLTEINQKDLFARAKGIRKFERRKRHQSKLLDLVLELNEAQCPAPVKAVVILLKWYGIVKQGCLHKTLDDGSYQAITDDPFAEVADLFLELNLAYEDCQGASFSEENVTAFQAKMAGLDQLKEKFGKLSTFVQRYANRRGKFLVPPSTTNLIKEIRAVFTGKLEEFEVFKTQLIRAEEQQQTQAEAAAVETAPAQQVDRSRSAARSNAELPEELLAVVDANITVPLTFLDKAREVQGNLVAWAPAKAEHIYRYVVSASPFDKNSPWLDTPEGVAAKECVALLTWYKAVKQKQRQLDRDGDSLAHFDQLISAVKAAVTEIVFCHANPAEGEGIYSRHQSVEVNIQQLLQLYIGRESGRESAQRLVEQVSGLYRQATDTAFATIDSEAREHDNPRALPEISVRDVGRLDLTAMQSIMKTVTHDKALKINETFTSQQNASLSAIQSQGAKQIIALLRWYKPSREQKLNRVDGADRFSAVADQLAELWASYEQVMAANVLDTDNQAGRAAVARFRANMAGVDALQREFGELSNLRYKKRVGGEETINSLVRLMEGEAESRSWSGCDGIEGQFNDMMAAMRRRFEKLGAVQTAREEKHAKDEAAAVRSRKAALAALSAAGERSILHGLGVNGSLRKRAASTVADAASSAANVASAAATAAGEVLGDARAVMAEVRERARSRLEYHRGRKDSDLLAHELMAKEIFNNAKTWCEGDDDKGIPPAAEEIVVCYDQVGLDRPFTGDCPGWLAEEDGEKIKQAMALVECYKNIKCPRYEDDSSNIITQNEALANALGELREEIVRFANNVSNVSVLSEADPESFDAGFSHLQQQLTALKTVTFDDQSKHSSVERLAARVQTLLREVYDNQVVPVVERAKEFKAQERAALAGRLYGGDGQPTEEEEWAQLEEEVAQAPERLVVEARRVSANLDAKQLNQQYFSANVDVSSRLVPAGIGGEVLAEAIDIVALLKWYPSTVPLAPESRLVEECNELAQSIQTLLLSLTRGQQLDIRYEHSLLETRMQAVLQTISPRSPFAGILTGAKSRLFGGHAQAPAGPRSAADLRPGEEESPRGDRARSGSGPSHLFRDGRGKAPQPQRQQRLTPQQLAEQERQQDQLTRHGGDPTANL